GVAFVNGVEVLRPDQVVATTTSDADGHYLFNQPTPGQYTVREAPPANWRQVAPFFSDPSFTNPAGNDHRVPGFPSGTLIITADFNGDGFADVAGFNYRPVGNGSVVILYNDQKDGLFSLVDVNTQLAFYPIVAAVPCDLNGDGRMDIAVLTSGN